MSYTIILQQRIFKFPQLQLKNFIFNFTIPLLFSSSIHSSSRSSYDAESLYTSLLKKSTRRCHLNQIHNQLYIHGLQNTGYIITKFINVCSDLKEIDYARQVFDEFPHPYVFLWNAIIRGYSAHNMLENVVEMYSRMQEASVNPDAFTFPCVLRACGALLAVGYGWAIHAQIFRHGFEEDSFLQNGLLSFYVKCKENSRARVIFDRLRCRDVVSWTLMISGCAQNGQPMEALMIFRDMRVSNVKPDWIVLVSVSKAYCDVEELNQGRCLHSLVIKMGHESEPDLRVALTSLYAKCGQVMSAKSLFDQTEAEGVMVWNSMISGFAKSGHANEALKLFNDMLSTNIQPDAVTVQSSVLACAQLGSLEQAKWMDNYVQNSNFKDNVSVSTALVDMFAKCGSLELARKVFNCIEDKDVVVWSAMIMGYALHGRGRDALNLFNEMKNAHVRPNDVTFLGLITACSHSGLLDEGWEIFVSMNEYGVEPHQKHYASVVDLLGRGGHLEKAYDFILGMPVEPGISVWGALLSACKMHRRVSLGEYAAERVFSLDGQKTGHYVQLSNLYASARLWDGVARVRVAMKSRGLVKDLGLSMIEVNGKLEGFRVGDEFHPRWGEIYEKLEWLETRLMERGFARDAESGLHDLDGEEREMSLCKHSERMAIAYGLISTCDGTTLRIIKNLRACVNCHLATKMISKVVDREIVVRDANRFHHFKDGVCSCGDYW